MLLCSVPRAISPRGIYVACIADTLTPHKSCSPCLWTCTCRSSSEFSALAAWEYRERGAMTTTTIKLLLVEDRQEDYLLTKHLLSHIRGGDFELTWAATYQEGLAELARCQYDICL